ncbi:MAG TPA: hypothetical protein VI141_00740 [Acidimicrobiia bacterium]
MGEVPKFSDLVVEAVSDHGKATADLFKRIGRGEDVDILDEVCQRVSHLTQTAARFLMFWDNIATLLAEDPAGPLTFPPPEPCADGEMQTFELPLQSVGVAALQSGLRRRGDDGRALDDKALTLSSDTTGVLKLVVDCSGLMRGLYEGSVQVVEADGKQSVKPYNVYISPGAQSS